jgi:hypothetical protein
LKVRRIFKQPYLLILALCFCFTSRGIANPQYLPGKDSLSTSSQQQAIAFIDSIKIITPSTFWPNIKPVLFLQNLKTTIHNPVSIYPGNGTNFCGYGALTYLLLKDDPLGYAKLLLQLYKDGKAKFGNSIFNPSAVIKKEAGMLKFKGILDIHPAEQMWFLSLADHYKGYVNLFNRKYNPGDEDTRWASVNYAKFNRMIKSLLRYKVKSRGSDLIRPHTGDLYQYISKRLATGMVVLYINNRIVHKKNHVQIKISFPTHFVVAERVTEANGIITLVYWDYGGRTQMQLSPAFFKRIIFGITYCTKNQVDVN